MPSKTPPRMRLIFVNRYFWPDHSATAQMLEDLAIELCRAGFDVTVIASRQCLDMANARLPRYEDHNGIQVLRLSTTRFGRNWLPGRALDYLTFYIASTMTLLRHIRKGDVVIAMTDPPLLGTALSATVRLLRGRLVIWWQDVYPEAAVRLGVLNNRALASTLRILRNRSLRAAQLNVVIGEHMRRFLLREAPDARIELIGNWSRDHHWTTEPPADSALRVQLGLQRKLIVGYSGNLGRAHNLTSLLAASVRLQHFSQLHFLLIGGGVGYAQLKEQCLKLGLRNWSFAPYQSSEALADALGAIDLHVVSLRPELEGLIVPSKIYGVLSVARGSVVLAAPDGELSQFNDSAQIMRIVTPDDVESLCRVLTELISDRGILLQMGRRSRQTFERHHTLDTAVRSWSELLHQLVNDK